MIAPWYGFELALPPAWEPVLGGPGTLCLRAQVTRSLVVAFAPRPARGRFHAAFDAWLLESRGRRRVPGERALRLPGGPAGVLALGGTVVVAGVAQARWFLLAGGLERLPLLAASPLPLAEARAELEPVLAGLSITSPHALWAA